MTITHVRTHTTTKTDFTKAVVRSILEHPEGHEWSLQGFGMLRTYLDPERRFRLHVWDSEKRNAGVSDMHTHPWDFLSLVVAGKVRNTRYIKDGEGSGYGFTEHELRCGVGGNITGNTKQVNLVAMPTEVYTEGQTYTQHANEIHVSDPVDGTVMIVAREFKEDTEHAFVYVPEGLEWVTAEPRPADMNEVARITQRALAAWF